jgi:hypothetical protein
MKKIKTYLYLKIGQIIYLINTISIDIFSFLIAYLKIL